MVQDLAGGQHAVEGDIDDDAVPPDENLVPHHSNLHTNEYIAQFGPRPTAPGFYAHRTPQMVAGAFHPREQADDPGVPRNSTEDVASILANIHATMGQGVMGHAAGPGHGQMMPAGGYHPRAMPQLQHWNGAPVGMPQLQQWAGASVTMPQLQPWDGTQAGASIITQRTDGRMTDGVTDG